MNLARQARNLMLGILLSAAALGAKTRTRVPTVGETLNGTPFHYGDATGGERTKLVGLEVTSTIYGRFGGTRLSETFRTTGGKIAHVTTEMLALRDGSRIGSTSSPGSVRLFRVSPGGMKVRSISDSEYRMGYLGASGQVLAKRPAPKHGITHVRRRLPGVSRELRDALVGAGWHSLPLPLPK